MQAGSLRHRVTLQRPALVRTDRGGSLEQYIDWVTVWASVEPLTPREYFAAQQVASDADVRIRIRWREGLDAKLRVKWERGGGSPTKVRYYDVDGPPIELDTQRREIHLMCKLRDAEGFRTGDPS